MNAQPEKTTGSAPGRDRAGLFPALQVGIAALAAVSLFHLFRNAHALLATGFVDLPIFLRQAAQFLESGALYPDMGQADAVAPAAAVYKFPPLFAVLLLPLVRFGDPAPVLFAHWLAQILLFVAAVAIVCRAFGGGLRFAVPAALLALNFEPFLETLWRLQLETPILALLAIALGCLLRRREEPAGVALALAASLKLYPAFLVLYLVATRRFRAVVWFAGTSLMLFVVGWIVIGTEQNVAFYTAVLPQLLAESPLPTTENVGLARYLQTLLDLDPSLSKRVAQLLVAPLILLGVWAAHRRREADLHGATLGFGMFVALMLLWMPNCWVNYQLLLLVPLLALLRYALSCEENRERRVLLTVVALAYVPLLFYWPCRAPDVAWPCAQTPLFLGLVALPRGLHDALVATRGISTLALALVPLALLLRPPQGAAAPGAAEA
ncbi:MAG: DUF2029 domain-containing protein [bacterium]|nr:DUF2029 domain-containing protein [bacterium]